MSENIFFVNAFATNIVIQIINSALENGGWNQINYNNIDFLSKILNINLNTQLKFLSDIDTDFKVIINNLKPNVLKPKPELWEVIYNNNDNQFNITPIESIGIEELETIRNTLKSLKDAKENDDLVYSSNKDDTVGVYGYYIEFILLELFKVIKTIKK